MYLPCKGLSLSKISEANFNGSFDKLFIDFFNKEFNNKISVSKILLSTQSTSFSKFCNEIP
jgi:hypothetical protein